MVPRNVIRVLFGKEYGILFCRYADRQNSIQCLLRNRVRLCPKYLLTEFYLKERENTIECTKQNHEKKMNH